MGSQRGLVRPQSWPPVPSTGPSCPQVLGRACSLCRVPALPVLIFCLWFPTYGSVGRQGSTKEGGHARTDAVLVPSRPEAAPTPAAWARLERGQGTRDGLQRSLRLSHTPQDLTRRHSLRSKCSWQVFKFTLTGSRKPCQASARPEATVQRMCILPALCRQTAMTPVMKISAPGGRQCLV